MAEYLIKLPITQYPIALLGIDARNSNAYNMGLKFTEYYNLDNNRKIGTYNRLKVGTILEYTSLPSINSSSVKKVGWDNHIKEPFEKSLDELINKKVLINWEYTSSKGKELTNYAATPQKYEEWKELFLEFELSNVVDFLNYI